MCECREAKRRGGGGMTAPRDGHGKKQRLGGREGSKEGDAGALQSR